MSKLDEMGGLEALASKLHDIYQEEAKRQGDVRHKDAYEELPENIKEFDRVLARFITQREQALVERVEELDKQLLTARELAENVEAFKPTIGQDWCSAYEVNQLKAKARELLKEGV